MDCIKNNREYTSLTKEVEYQNLEIQLAEKKIAQNEANILHKKEIIKLGLSLNVNYGLTSSCYDPLTSGDPCGECDACYLRLKGFRSISFKDPFNFNVNLDISKGK